jgi:hypothetical protein
MSSSYGRPADRAAQPGGWESTRARFDLGDLTTAQSAGLLLQWALSRHLHAEIARAGYRSTRAFARANQLSENSIANFLNGHRRANFEDLAAMVEILGPRAWPTPSRLDKYIEGAQRRSSGEAADGPQFTLYPPDQGD